MTQRKGLDYFNQDEINILNQISKVIIWGYPLHSHTQSYLHYGWHKVFQELGKETYWFDDEKYDKNIDYKNCLFIAEGYQEKNIPLHSSNIYFINFCIYPDKYIRCGARLIELRFRVEKFDDINNYWDLNDGTHNLENLSDETLYERLTSNIGVGADFTGLTKQEMNYECIYLYWATDLMPWEINLEHAEYVAKPVIHFVGTFYEKGIWAEYHKLTKEKGIEWIHHNPWSSPLSFEENRELIKKSVLAPDFRPETHVKSGYIPCRLFKNISYGNIPSTNSPAAKKLLGDAVIYNENIQELIEENLLANKDIERKKRAMKMVAEKHTYIQRARDLMRALLKPRPEPIQKLFSTWNQVTIVTGLLHIGREGADGRTMEQYVQWFSQTLRIPAPMVVYCEHGLEDLVKQVRGSLPTKIIVQNLMTSPFGWSYPKVEEILKSESFKSQMQHPNDLTNRLPGYSIVTNNKFAWLWRAIDENPFKTDMFFWIDGGLSRFFRGFEPWNSEPNIRTVRDLRKTRKIFCVVGGQREEYIERVNHGIKLPIEKIIGGNLGVVMTGFFGGHISVMKEVSEAVMKNYVVEMIGKNRIDHDQSSIFLHYQEHPEKYLLVPSHPQFDCFNFFLFAAGHHFPMGV